MVRVEGIRRILKDVNIDDIIVNVRINGAKTQTIIFNIPI